MTTKKVSTKKATGKDAPRLIQYAPEVEARRPLFESVARHLSELLQLHYSKDALEIDPPGDNDDEPAGYILWSAIDEHVHGLFQLLDWSDPRFLSTLYVELRLFLEQREHELKALPVGGVATAQVEVLAKRLSDFMQDASSAEQKRMAELIRELEGELFPLGYEHTELAPTAKVVLGRAHKHLHGTGKYEENNRAARERWQAIMKLLSDFES